MSRDRSNTLACYHAIVAFVLTGLVTQASSAVVWVAVLRFEWPSWLTVVLYLVPFVAAGIAFVISRRRSERDEGVARGCCARCAYDLTGNVSGRCPECGCATPTTRESDTGR